MNPPKYVFLWWDHYSEQWLVSKLRSTAHRIKYVLAKPSPKRGGKKGRRHA